APQARAGSAAGTRLRGARRVTVPYAVELLDRHDIDDAVAARSGVNDIGDHVDESAGLACVRDDLDPRVARHPVLRKEVRVLAIAVNVINGDAGQIWPLEALFEFLELIAPNDRGDLLEFHLTNSSLLRLPPAIGPGLCPQPRGSAHVMQEDGCFCVEWPDVSPGSGRCC